MKNKIYKFILTLDGPAVSDTIIHAKPKSMSTIIKTNMSPEHIVKSIWKKNKHFNPGNTLYLVASYSGECRWT